MSQSIRLSPRAASALSLAVLTIAACPSLAVTQTSSWAGPGNSNWNAASHWTPAGVPNNGTNGITDYNVIIGAPSPTLLDINASIDALTVNAGAQLTINPTFTLNIAGPTLVDDGVIQIDTLNQNAALNFTANTAITGSGTIVLNDYNPSARFSANPGVVVTQALTHTISGVGDLTAGLVNNGTVNANFPSRALTLTTSNMTNNGLFEATNNGVLAINGIVVTQGANGQIYTGNIGTVTMTGTTISGGTLNTAPGRSIAVTTGTFNNVTLGAGANVVVQSGSTLTVTGSTLVNNGTIQIDTVSNNASINFASNIQLSGSGSIFLDDYNPNAALTSATTATVTQAAGHTIYGVGEIDAGLINNGIVNANTAIGSKTLTLQTRAMTNNNLFEATASGILDINGIAITQGAAGQIAADAFSTVNIRAGAVINGGTISSTVGGSIITTNATFNGVTIGSGTFVKVTSASILTIAGGTLVNNGLIQVDEFVKDAALNFATNTVLSGTGSVYLDDYNPNARITAAAGATLTQAVGHTIYGIGEIDAPFINNGTVTANRNVGTKSLVLQISPMTNNAVMQATTGAILNVNGITLTQSAGGKLVAGAGSSVLLNGNATVNGGTLNGPGTVSMANTTDSPPPVTATLSGVTINPGATLSVANFSTGVIKGGTVNNGAIDVGGSLSIAGLTGSGSFAISGTSPGIVTLPAGSGLSSQGSLFVNNFGKLDLVNNSFAVNYGAANPTPVAALRTLLRSAWTNGTWTGYGITSSKAAVTTGYGIGYADGTDGAAAGQVLLRYALAGDSNLDGKVNFDDLIRLAQHYNTTGGQLWTQGDFTYDGAINFDDLIILAQSYNATFTALQAAQTGASFAADFALARSLVPEPTASGILVAAGLWSAGRRRARNV